jgi:D-alanyl-D-alanine carboxypeptidase/D-alanyl-D-alanine-endopeptidase (penicillin-binding protein 4)
LRVPGSRKRRVAAVAAGLGLALAASPAATASGHANGHPAAHTAAHTAAPATGVAGVAGAELTARPVLDPIDGPGAGSGTADTKSAAASGAEGAAAQAPAPTRAQLARVIAPLLGDPALGPVRTAVVIDAATGRTLYGHDAGTEGVPASTTKLATATAVLHLLGPDHRFATRVMLSGASGKNTLTLVGGGDPTLTARAHAGGGYGAASLRTLADRTAAAAKAQHLGHLTLAYDTSLFTGPSVHPIGRNDNLAPVTALTADEGREDASWHGPAPREYDPAQSAANTFAGLLRDRGLKVTATPAKHTAPAGATQLAAVDSAPLSALVARMLTNSDNDIAETLARQVAVAAHRPASFTGGAAAITATLRALKVPLAGARFHDGSGLNHADRLSAAQLAGLLALAGRSDRPELRPILTGLPIAAFIGSLKHRYSSGPTASGAGLIRAKTGTLTGVNSLAGTVVDRHGRLLDFAFLTTGTTDPYGAEAALDRLAAAVGRT